MPYVHTVCVYNYITVYCTVHVYMLASMQAKSVDFQQVANLQMVEKLLMDGDEPV